MEFEKLLGTPVKREADENPSCITGLETGQQALNSTTASRLQRGPVMRSVATLRLHSALAEFDWAGVLSEFGDATRSNNLSVAQPVLITADGIILAGFGQWQSATLAGLREISCIEYGLGDAEALLFIVGHHQPSRAWNSFTRIRLALKLEPFFQEKALGNMRSGGKHKGLAKLPDAQRLDVRQQIADAAGVGSRNVLSVKMILQTGHPQLITALQTGLLSIHRASQICKHSKAHQAALLLEYVSERENSKVISQVLSRLKENQSSPTFTEVVNALKRQEADRPGSVIVRRTQLRHSVVIIGNDLHTSLAQEPLVLE